MTRREASTRAGGLAKDMNALTQEQVAAAMERLPTDALEWAVKFEALGHSRREQENDT